MPNVSISPILNAQVVKDNGDPASGWKIFCYVANSSTPQPAYTDSSGAVAQSNPIILDSSGFATQGQIWLADGQFYKFILTDENNVSKRTFNDISGVNDPSQLTGEQWLDIGTVATYLSANSFSLAGDQVTEYHIGRRVQLKQGATFVYGYITASSFSVDDQLTTVTVKLDSATPINVGLSQSNLSLLRADHHALPKVALDLISLNVDTSINAQTINLTGALNRAPQGTIASAATTDIFTVNADSVLVTGTTTITSFGVAPAGVVRTVEFQDSLILTYNATSLILPGAANITTGAGDVMQIYSKGAGNWKVIEYTSYVQPPSEAFSVPRVQVFSTPGNSNFTVPAGVTRVKVTVVGGGAGAFVGSQTQSIGSPGGGTAIKTISGLTPNQVIPVVVGAGGAINGIAGGTSSFGSFCSATGGRVFGPIGVSPYLPGVGLDGDLNISGGLGTIEIVRLDTDPQAISMSGGTFLSPLGAYSYGAGGSSGSTLNAGVLTPGKAGVVIVEY